MDWQAAVYKDYRWIVADPELLGGTLAEPVRGDLNRFPRY